MPVHKVSCKFFMHGMSKIKTFGLNQEIILSSAGCKVLVVL